jgi:hypothetical protein
MNPVRGPKSDVRGPKIEIRKSKIGSPVTISDFLISGFESRLRTSDSGPRTPDLKRDT